MLFFIGLGGIEFFLTILTHFLFLLLGVVLAIGPFIVLLIDFNEFLEDFLVYFC